MGPSWHFMYLSFNWEHLHYMSVLYSVQHCMPKEGPIWTETLHKVMKLWLIWLFICEYSRITILKYITIDSFWLTTSSKHHLIKLSATVQCCYASLKNFLTKFPTVTLVEDCFCITKLYKGLQNYFCPLSFANPSNFNTAKATDYTEGS